MKIKILITSLLITLFFIGNINAQKSNLPGKLPWVNGNLPANSINYNYKVVVGDGDNLSEAKNNAFESLIFELGKEHDLTKVMVSQNISSLAFQMTLNVRNKMLNAYKDIMNMPV